MTHKVRTEQAAQYQYRLKPKNTIDGAMTRKQKARRAMSMNESPNNQLRNQTSESEV
jgi:hypothetical protein